MHCLIEMSYEKKFMVHEGKLLLHQCYQGRAETILLAEGLAPDLTPWDLPKYKDVIHDTLVGLGKNDLYISQFLDSLDLPVYMSDLSFDIRLVEGLRHFNGCLLENFHLFKKKGGTFRWSGSVGFGNTNSYNPGGGGSGWIPGIYFRNLDRSGLAAYMEKMCYDLFSITADDIMSNEEIEILFMLLADLSKKSQGDGPSVLSE